MSTQERRMCDRRRFRHVTPDWSDLPIDMLLLIAQRFVYIEDYVTFCSVCKSWRFVTSILGKRRSLAPRHPWIMLPDRSMFGKKPDPENPKLRMIEPPEETKDSRGREMRGFYSLSTSKTYEFELPEATHRVCKGAHYGWLLTVGFDLQISLLHPFSRQQIRLPPLLSFKEQYEYIEGFTPQHVVDFFVMKVVLSENPSGDFTAVAIYGMRCMLAFARRGDEVWRDIVVTSTVYEDVIYYNNMFYAVDCRGVIFVCDINNANGPQATPIAEAAARVGVEDWDQKYLVESSGNLLLVARIRDTERDSGSESGRTTGFVVFMMEDSDDQESSKYPYKWLEVKNLGGRALFLGGNVSVSLGSSESSVKPNCIYFSEDDGAFYIDEVDGGGRDTGIFNVEHGTIEQHHAANFRCPLSPPLWYI